MATRVSALLSGCFSHIRPVLRIYLYRVINVFRIFKQINVDNFHKIRELSTHVRYKKKKYYNYNYFAFDCDNVRFVFYRAYKKQRKCVGFRGENSS